MITREKLFRFSWYLLIFIIPFETLQIAINGFNIRAHQIILLITIITSLIAYYKNIPEKLKFLHKNIFNFNFWYNNIYLSLFLGVAITYIIGGLFFGISTQLTIIRGIAFLGYIVLFGLIYYGINSKFQLFNVFKTLFYSTTILILFGIYEAVAFQMGWHNFMYFPGRVDSFFPEPNWLSMFMAFIYAILIPLYYFSNDKKEKILLALMFIGVTFTSILAMGRAAWLTMIILNIVFILQNIISKSFSKKLISFIISISLFSTLAVFLSQTGLTNFDLQNRFTSTFTHEVVIEDEVVRDINVDIRYESYLISLIRYQQSPFIGMGPTEEHNLFLGVLVGSGIIGISLFLSVLYLLFKQSILFYRQKPQVITLMYLIPISIIVTGIFNDSLLFGAMWLMFAIATRIPDLIVYRKL
jgi:O-antigen ligase